MINGNNALLAGTFTRTFLHRSMLFRRVLMDRNCFCKIRIFTLCIFSRHRFRSILIVYDTSVNESTYRSNGLQDARAALTNSGLMFIITGLTRNSKLCSTSFKSKVNWLLRHGQIRFVAKLIKVSHGLQRLCLVSEKKTFNLCFVRKRRNIWPTSWYVSLYRLFVCCLAVCGLAVQSSLFIRYGCNVCRWSLVAGRCGRFFSFLLVGSLTDTV